MTRHMFFALWLLGAMLHPFAMVWAQGPAGRATSGPTNIIGRGHPGRISGVTGDGLTVGLQNGSSQMVAFGEIWRIRAAFASDEPAGTSVIDAANNRLFVTTPLASLVEDVGRNMPLAKMTAPNGDAVYLAAAKVTDISNALPGTHNPLSRAVVGTRDGTQQVLEPVDVARRAVGAARPATP